MDHHLYLSLIPEALIVSMLNPEEFASYYAVGEHGKSSGKALFIEIDPGFRSDFLPIAEGVVRCVPNSAGQPKTSVYVAVYRVLEHIPLSAMGDLYYVTPDGRALRSSKIPATHNEPGLHFYHELAPVRPSVVSPLGPSDFKDLLMGKRDSFQGLPAIAFIETRLDELADDPMTGDTNNLPYSNIEHLRECLVEVRGKAVSSKLYDRSGVGIPPYRIVKHGVFIGNHEEGMVLYPLPPFSELKETHHAWWRSASHSF